MGGNTISVGLSATPGRRRDSRAFRGQGPQTWGREEGDRVDVRSEDGHVTTVTVRVDVRRLDSRFGAALLEFVKRAGAVLVRGDGLVVEPTIGAYAAALRSSDAWTFASDPAAFLASNALDEDED